MSGPPRVIVKCPTCLGDVTVTYHPVETTLSDKTKVSVVLRPRHDHNCPGPPGDHHVRCTPPANSTHGPHCPPWCCLRPGGATRPVPTNARGATTLMPPEYPENQP